MDRTGRPRHSNGSKTMRTATSRSHARFAATAGRAFLGAAILALLAGALHAQSRDTGASLSAAPLVPIRDPICLACPAFPVRFAGTSETGNYQEALDAALRQADAY